jgi:hypothetical protein
MARTGNERILQNARLLGELIAVIVCASTLGACADTASQRGEQITIERSWKGHHCGYTEPSKLVITTKDRWKEVWRKVHRRRLPRPELPDIDFGQEMVVAVFMGERSTGGYEVEVASVIRTEKEIVVDVRETQPPSGSPRTMALTQPYHIVVIERSPLPVRFQPQ